MDGVKAKTSQGDWTTNNLSYSIKTEAGQDITLDQAKNTVGKYTITYTFKDPFRGSIQVTAPWEVKAAAGSDAPSPTPQGSTENPSPTPQGGSTDTPSPTPQGGSTDTPSPTPQGSTDSPAPTPTTAEPSPEPSPAPTTPPETTKPEPTKSQEPSDTSSDSNN